MDGALVSFRFLSLQDYIIAAYDIKKHQLAGPDWLSTERFDIQAKVPAGVAPEQMRDKRREMTLRVCFVGRLRRPLTSSTWFKLALCDAMIFCETSCPASEVRDPPRHPLTRTSEAKGH